MGAPLGVAESKRVLFAETPQIGEDSDGRRGWLVRYSELLPFGPTLVVVVVVAAVPGRFGALGAAATAGGLRHSIKMARTCDNSVVRQWRGEGPPTPSLGLGGDDDGSGAGGLAAVSTGATPAPRRLVASPATPCWLAAGNGGGKESSGPPRSWCDGVNKENADNNDKAETDAAAAAAAAEVVVVAVAVAEVESCKGPPRLALRGIGGSCCCDAGGLMVVRCPSQREQQRNY